MSYGYARKVRKARRLTNLQITEVSSVGRGAAHGARVLITKGHNMRDVAFENIGKAMPGVLPVQIAKSLNQQLADGSISTTEYAEFQRGLAQTMFPTDPPAAAFTKFLDSAVGRDMIASYNRAHYEKLQRDNALGSGVSKGEAAVALDDNQDGKCDDVDGGDSDGADDLMKIAKDIQRLHSEMNLSQAIDAAIRTAAGRNALDRSLRVNLRRQYPVSP